jgi:hypothetical protein
LDNRYVTLRDSESFPLAGEGAIAKVDIPAETIFCHFSGLLLTSAQLDKQKRDLVAYMKENNLTLDHKEVEDTWKYR